MGERGSDDLLGSSRCFSEAMDSMAGLGGFGGTGTGEAEEGMGQLEQAAAMAQIQQLMESQKTLAKLTAKCYTACVSSPGKSLASGQQVCLWRCAQRYMETQHFVQKYCEDKVKSGTWSAPSTGAGM